LGCTGVLLHVLHLDHSPAAPTIGSGAIIRSVPWYTFSSGTYIVTAHHGESVITITSLCSQTPSPSSQFIDTGLKIFGIVLTGNVLLVKGAGMVVAWLLTEEGAVGGIFGERRVGRSDSLWDVQYQAAHPSLLRRRHLKSSDNDENGDSLQFSVMGEMLPSKSDSIQNLFTFTTPKPGRSSIQAGRV